MDKTPPEVGNCPSNVSETVELGEPGANITWIEPTAFDNFTLVHSSNHIPGDFFPIGVTTVFYAFIHQTHLYVATCTFMVVVQTREYTYFFKWFFQNSKRYVIVCNYWKKS